MDTILLVLGILIVLFFTLSMMNGAKRYTDSKIIKRIAAKHKLFGIHTMIAGLIHMILAIIDGQLRITGLITFLALFATGLCGMLFYKTKNKKLYIAHRILGPVTFILIIMHIILNSSI